MNKIISTHDPTHADSAFDTALWRYWKNKCGLGLLKVIHYGLALFSLIPLFLIDHSDEMAPVYYIVVEFFVSLLICFVICYKYIYEIIIYPWILNQIGDTCSPYTLGNTDAEHKTEFLNQFARVEGVIYKFTANPENPAGYDVHRLGSTTIVMWIYMYLCRRTVSHHVHYQLVQQAKRYTDGAVVEESPLELPQTISDKEFSKQMKQFSS